MSLWTDLTINYNRQGDVRNTQRRDFPHSLKLNGPPIGADQPTPTIADFYAYPGTGLTAFCTGGILTFNGSPESVGASMALTLADNTTNYIFVEVAIGTSLINNDTAEPFTEAHLLLATAVTSGGVISSFVRQWNGGDFIFPASFPITASQSGGSSAIGDLWTYNAFDLKGNSLTNSSPVSPTTSPCRGFPMTVDTAGTKGEGRWKADGTFELWSVNETTANSTCGS